MSKKRQDYLDAYWRPYPSIGEPSEDFLYGRIREFHERGELTHLIMERNFQIFKAEVSKDFSFAGEFRLSEVLLEGDIVAVSKKEIVLLVPCKQKMALREFKLERAQAWNQFKEKVRFFFTKQGFCHIDTPSLVPSPGLETYLHAFETSIVRGREPLKCYLPTSPEFHLKKALAIGFDRVFEIAKAFRNNESGPMHQLEFWMLEWYRSYNNLESIIEDCRCLIDELFSIDSFPIFSVKELFRIHLKFQLSPSTTILDLQGLCESLNIPTDSSDDFDDLYFKIFLEKIEPKLSGLGFFGIRDYPPSQAALARINTQGWADRFELYFGAIELANGYHELNDPLEQSLRFEKTIEEKRKRNLELVEYDEDLISYMQMGMPPSGGIAMGLDRLFLVYAKLPDLSETRLFPID